VTGLSPLSLNFSRPPLTADGRYDWRRC